MNEEINIEKIMQEIRQDIKSRGYKESEIHFEDIPVRNSVDVGSEIESFDRNEFQKSIDYINKNWEIPYYFPLGTNKTAVFIKRVIRKLIKFLLYPINQQQNEMNAHFVKSFNQLRNYIDEKNTLNAQVDNLEYIYNRQIKKEFINIQEHYHQYNKLTDDWKKDFASMQEMVNQLSDENAILKKRLEILSLKYEKLELLITK